MTIIAAIGWILFALTACLYFVGNRLNSEESHSLAIYSLALLLSDEFRESSRKGFEIALHHGRSAGKETQELVYGLMQGVTINAKTYYKGNPITLDTGKTITIDTLRLVADHINKMP